MMGGPQAPHAGIIPRSIRQVLQTLNPKPARSIRQVLTQPKNVTGLMYLRANNNVTDDVPRSILQILSTVQEMAATGWSHELECSCLEIYNESVRALHANP